MFEWIERLIYGGGYWGLLFLTFIENVFPPIPSELIMPMAGFLARDGKMVWIVAVLVGALGSTLGSLPLYYAAKFYGEKRLKAFADKYGVWLAIDGDDIEKSQKAFAKHQSAAVFWGRLVPGIRSLIALPAGFSAMPLPKFLILTFAGCFVWTSFLAAAGYWLGPAFKSVDKVLGPLTYVILGAIVAWLAWRAWNKKKAKKNAPKPVKI